VEYDNKKHTIITGLEISPQSQEKLKATEKELLQERDGVTKFLPN
jgi:hypothetical protein